MKWNILYCMDIALLFLVFVLFSDGAYRPSNQKYEHTRTNGLTNVVKYTRLYGHGYERNIFSICYFLYSFWDLSWHKLEKKMHWQVRGIVVYIHCTSLVRRKEKYSISISFRSGAANSSSGTHINQILVKYRQQRKRNIKRLLNHQSINDIEFTLRIRFMCA